MWYLSFYCHNPPILIYEMIFNKNFIRNKWLNSEIKFYLRLSCIDSLLEIVFLILLYSCCLTLNLLWYHSRDKMLLVVTMKRFSAKTYALAKIRDFFQCFLSPYNETFKCLKSQPASITTLGLYANLFIQLKILSYKLAALSSLIA